MRILLTTVGWVVERMPADDMLVCERACTLRTTRNVGEHCQFFIFNSETRECQLLASNTKTCYMELGPSLESRACFFSKIFRAGSTTSPLLELGQPLHLF